MIWVILSASAIVATFNHAAAGQMINDRRSSSVNVPYMVNYELPELPYYRLEDVEYYPPYADPDLSTEPAQFYRLDIFRITIYLESKYLFFLKKIRNCRMKKSVGKPEQKRVLVRDIKDILDKVKTYYNEAGRPR